MFRTLFNILAVATLALSPVYAEETATPEGEVLLTISGNIGTQNADTTIQLDLAMLEALEKSTIKTATIWTEGVQEFEGVSLKALVDAFGISGTTLLATAINDYVVEIPLTDAVEGGALVAYRLNGDTMSIREKGPLWIVYPYDADAKYRTEVIYSRSIWQLDRIQAVD